MVNTIPYLHTVRVSSADSKPRRKPDAAFGARLKAARESKGLSQEDVAERVNVSVQTVSNWETGYRTPGAEYLFSLAEIYDESPSYLLKGVRPKSIQALSEDALWRELAGRVLSLPSDRQEQVLRSFITLLERQG